MPINLGVRPAKSTMPGTMIIMGPPKMGKSAIAADLTTTFAPNKSLILSLHETGYDALEANYHECPSAKTFVKSLKELKQMNEDKGEGEYLVDFLVVDHTSKLDEWAEIYGTINYMSSIQGKNWNYKLRDTNPNAMGPGYSASTRDQYYSPKDPQFKSVYNLADGAG